MDGLDRVANWQTDAMKCKSQFISGQSYAFLIYTIVTAIRQPLCIMTATRQSLLMTNALLVGEDVYR